MVAIVGRPNVGKSTLFNALTRTRDALVADTPGVTRDRIYGRARIGERDVILIDTGGLDDSEDEIVSAARVQTRLAVGEADVVLLVVDARAGVMPADRDIATWLRKQNKPLLLAVNKSDGLNEDQVVSEAAELGIEPQCLIAASHRRGLEGLGRKLAERLPPADTAGQREDEGIRLALIGRPNVGKSTLLNRMLGQERALASPTAGTTRDPVHASIERDGQVFHLVDTAGIRRRRGSHTGIEGFSTIKALQAMEQAEVVALLIDASEGVTEQDARLAGHVMEAGRALVLVLNKWDSLSEKRREKILVQMAERLDFATFAPVVAASALHGSGLGEFTDAVGHVYGCATQEISTSALTRVLRKAVEVHPPPGGKRATPKLRYAHAGGSFPMRVVIHGNRTAQVPDSYRRYLINSFRKHFDFTGVPIHILFKDSDNPYAGRRNKLTPRQIQKRKRARKLGRGR